MSTLGLLAFSVVRDRTSLSRSTIYRKIKAHAFPPPVSKGPGGARWNEADIDCWIGNPRGWSEASRQG